MLTLILITFLVDGRSVEPTYMDHEMVQAIYAPCPVDDYIAFDYKGERYIKQLKEYTGRGDIWVEGRSDIWSENDKRRKSYDSRIYGYIPYDQYNIIGCIK